MITDFLDTDTSKDDLAIALRVLREFKECESGEEWLMTPFVTWAKLEQMEKFLAHMVEGAALPEDTVRVRDSSSAADKT